jgi:hypothetical protein
MSLNECTSTSPLLPIRHILFNQLLHDGRSVNGNTKSTALITTDFSKRKTCDSPHIPLTPCHFQRQFALDKPQHLLFSKSSFCWESVKHCGFALALLHSSSGSFLQASTWFMFSELMRFAREVEGDGVKFADISGRIPPEATNFGALSNLLKTLIAFSSLVRYSNSRE